MKILTNTVLFWLLYSGMLTAQTISQPVFSFSWYAHQGFGQSFTATQTANIERIVVEPSSNFPVGSSFTLMLFNSPADMSANISTANAAHTQTFEKMDHGNACITLTTPFSVVAGQQYSFLVLTPSAQGISANQNDPYAGGDVYVVGSTGNISPISGGDLVFSIWEGAVTPPTLNLGNDVTGCGTSVQLNAGAASSYLWSTGQTSQTIQAATTGSYSVRTFDSNNCPAYDTVQVTIDSVPTVTANTTAAALCEGETLTLTGGGADTYVWDNGVTNGQAFTPTATATYSVTGTDGNGCENTATVSVDVNDLPTVTANASAATLCEGEELSLTGDGADTYVWDNGVSDGQAFAPAATATYSVTGTDVNGCENTATAEVTVNTVDNGLSLSGGTLSAAASAASYQWIDCGNGNAIINNETNQDFTPTVTGDYAVIVSQNGCVDTSACQTVTVVGVNTLLDLGWAVFPNPTKGQLTVELAGIQQFVQTELFNALGQSVLLVGTANTASVDLNVALPTGLYLLKITADGGKEMVVKVVVSH